MRPTGLLTFRQAKLAPLTRRGAFVRSNAAGRWRCAHARTVPPGCRRRAALLRAQLDRQARGEVLKEADGLFACDRWEILQELVHAVACREIVEQRADRHAGASEHRHTSQDVSRAV